MKKLRNFFEFSEYYSFYFLVALAMIGFICHWNNPVLRSFDVLTIVVCTGFLITFGKIDAFYEDMTDEISEAAKEIREEMETEKDADKTTQN
jgi:hypothetical protein